MKILWITPRDMLTEMVHLGLKHLNQHDIHFHWFGHDKVPVDPHMIDAVDRIEPDVVLYIATSGGPLLAQTETFELIGKMAPVINLCFDGGHPGFWPLLETYKDRKTFWRTINMDGRPTWPHGENDYATLPPVDPAFYGDPPRLETRPINVGFCGGYPDGFRKEVVEHLCREVGMVVKPRNEKYGTYQAYADFLLKCKIVINPAVSAADLAKVVKARVLETAFGGAVLLEQSGSPTNLYFNDKTSYVTFDTVQDAAAQIESLLTTPRLMQEMATALHEAALARFSPVNFWTKAFEGLPHG
jgi:glycosyl transferase family 1